MATGRIALPSLLAGLALTCPAAAAPPAPHAAPVWAVDKAASRLSFRAVVAGKAFDGVIKRWDAQLAFDPGDLAASRLQVVVETGSAVTGDPARDVLLPSAAWLAAARFPRATFNSRAFAPEGAGRYRVSGTLTLRGVTHPLDGQAQIDVARSRLTLTGALPLDRRAFGVGPPADAAAAMVQVQVRLTARPSR